MTRGYHEDPYSGVGNDASASKPSLEWLERPWTTLALPASTWLTVTNLPVIGGNHLFNVFIATTNAQQFFRFSPTGSPMFYGGGWVDAARYAWLTNELQQGQDAGQLMIIAAHIPIDPQSDIFDATHNPKEPQFYVNAKNQSEFPGCKTEAEMIATLHQYPNLILFMAGHRHMNTVTPQPSPDPAHPENGFWEVETPSLRDFPQQFRIWEIRRNHDNTISIVTTDVDPQVKAGSLAWESRGFAIGVSRSIGITAFADVTSHAYNAELVKPLTPTMQAKMAAFGGPL